MTNTNTLIELHYYSGGLKSKITGANRRPEWLPDLDLVGLHNDVFPAQGEYVIELSRHKRLDKLITWVGIYSYGKDDQYGERSNYNGVGAWLIDTIPVHTSSIISALRDVCDLLVKHGPVESVQRACLDFNINYLPNFVSSIDVLPVVDKGIVFDVTSHPETLYIRANNKNIDSTLQNISSSVERNCIVADKACASFSRVLYLMLDQSDQIKNIKHSIDLPESYSPTEDLIEYFANSTVALKNKSIELHNQLIELDNQIQATESQSADKSKEITALAEKVSQLQEANLNLANQNSELTAKTNTKSHGEQLEELHINIASLSLDADDKAKLLQSIKALDEDRKLDLAREDTSQNLMPILNEIIRRLDLLRINHNKIDTLSNTTIEPAALEDEVGIDIFKILIFGALISLIILGAYFLFFKTKDESLSANEVETVHNGISTQLAQSADPSLIKFKITATPEKITSPTEIVKLENNSAAFGPLDNITPVYVVEYGGCKLDGKSLVTLPGTSHEICSVKAIYNDKEAETYIKVDIPRLVNETTLSGNGKPKK